MQLSDQVKILDALLAIWRWWLGELRELIPPRLAQWLSPQLPALVFLVHDGSSQVVLRDEDGARVLAECDLERMPHRELAALGEKLRRDLPESCTVELYLPGRLVLRHELFLPLAVEKNLETVLQYEMDRLTPFTCDAIRMGYRCLQKYPAHGKISVELNVARNDAIEALTATVRHLGGRLSAVYPPVDGRAAGAPGNQLPATMNMLPPDQRSVSVRVRAPAIRWMAVAAVLLACVVLGYPLWALERQASGLQSERTVLGREAEQISALRATLFDRLDTHAKLVERKNGRPGQLAILKLLTETLPDDTWVSRLEISAATVVIQGESSNTFALIELLERTDAFQNVRFGSSVTRNPVSNMERYEIEMQLEGQQLE